MEYASKGVSGTALGLGIAGTALGILDGLGGIGALLGNRQPAADDKNAPILRLIAHEEMRHARLLIDMIHELGGEVTDENHAEVHKAEKVVAK